MSQDSKQISPEIGKYIKQHFASVGKELDSLREEAKLAGFPDISIASEQAVALQQLVRIANAQNILEIGSLAGYSAFAMAMAQSGERAKTTTVDLEQASVDFINKKAAELGLQDRVRAVRSTGKEWVDSIEENEVFDFVFLDADKSSYIYYVEKLLPHVRSGGMIVADNAFAFGFVADETGAEPDSLDKIEAIRAFNQMLARDSRVQCSINPLGDGLIIAVKL